MGLRVFILERTASLTANWSQLLARYKGVKGRGRVNAFCGWLKYAEHFLARKWQKRSERKQLNVTG